VEFINKNLAKKIPREVLHVTEVLQKAGFEAYLVGGCVRDLLMSQILSGTEGDKEPKDWDITTNAKPEQIIDLFEKTIYENAFGTVGVCIPTSANVSHETLKYNVVEVTPYRIETKYSDFRHPDEVKFSDKLEDDLKRRDFTINAMALSCKGQLIDLFNGVKDIKNKILRTVGEPEDRFREDALRMLRAVRFAVQLGFSVSHEVSESIFKNANLIKKISAERIHDEFVKIIMSKTPSAGIVMLEKFGLLKNIIPELEEEIDCEQFGEHIFNVWDHSLHALQHAANKNWPLEIRLSALFHDIGKPRSRRIVSPSASVKKYTFYGHEIIGARMVIKILERLKFSRKEIDLMEKLVRNHMFFSDPEQITLSAVRRTIAKVGRENIWLLMNVRECDRVGMKKKEAPYRLRRYFAMIEEALRDPISVRQLKINGDFMIKDIGINPGPRMGWILHALLEEVLEDPKKNTLEYLKDKAQKLNKLSDTKLRVLGEKGREIKEKLEKREVVKLHEKHGVKSQISEE
jgi:poly(A) polymerase/tRNA nucleotidyltransferase (CCA-adding enzyme)